MTDDKCITCNEDSKILITFKKKGIKKIIQVCKICIKNKSKMTKIMNLPWKNRGEITLSKIS